MSLTTVDGSLISSGAITLTTQVTGTLPEANGGTGTTVGYCGFKNRIINGAMVIDQRNAGASGTAISAYPVDRWLYYGSQATKGTWQQNAGAVTPPAGFNYYLGFTSSSSYSVLATDQFIFKQSIEGYNTSDLAWGTANAKTITLSFWVRSSLTGTFGGAVQNSANDRNYPFSYSIPVANTWTTISVTIAGDTSGTWLTTNGTGLVVNFSLGTGATYSGTAGAWTSSSFITSATGATSVVGTSGATFYITGVQLEKGSTATSFDYRPYGTELALCQRYYSKIVSGNSGTGAIIGMGVTTTTTNTWGLISFRQSMRASPTVTHASMIVSNSTTYDAAISAISVTSTIDGVYLDITNALTTAGQTINIRALTNTSGYIAFSAEL